MNCPNCGSSAQVISNWKNGNGTRHNAEYICGCGCHWVDRYEFQRRDIINNGSLLVNGMIKKMNEYYEKKRE